MVLNYAWGWSGDHSNHWVARQIGVRTAAVRETRAAAERTALELYLDWRPAYDRWRNGEATKGDRAILAKHRLTKKGRWSGVRNLLPPPLGYKMRTLPFSEIGDPKSDHAWEPDPGMALDAPPEDEG
jgi:hypothetical protein